MGLQAEFLLLRTGLLEYPEKSHVRATSLMAKEITDACASIVKQSKPKELRAVPKRKTYYDQLVKDAHDVDYAKVTPGVALLIGAEEAGAWQLLRMAAQQRLITQRPVTEMQTLVGPVAIPNSPDQDAQYALEAETMENHMRCLQDAQAGALLLSQLQLWAGLFPETYKLIAGNPKEGELGAVRQAMAERKMKDQEWYPPSWLDGTLRVLLQVPFEAVVNVTGPRPNELTSQNEKAEKPGGRLKLDTIGQASQSQLVERPTQSKA